MVVLMTVTNANLSVDVFMLLFLILQWQLFQTLLSKLHAWNHQHLENPV